jgi:tetratricopeptide (TPR) repeat protein
MLPFSLLLSLTFWVFFAFPQTSSPPVFTQALESFKLSDLAKSRESFLQLLKESPNDPVLLYNLGLVEMTEKRPGKALAYWRKALYLRPGYSPALEGVKKIEKLKIPGLLNSSWLAKMPWYLSLSSLLALTLFSWTLTTIFAIRWRKAQKWNLPQRALIPFSVCFVVAATTTYLSWSHFSSTHKWSSATIIVDSASVHSSPSADAPSLFDFKEGDSVRLHRANGDWVQVQKSATALGWVKKEQILVHSGPLVANGF